MLDNETVCCKASISRLQTMCSLDKVTLASRRAGSTEKAADVFETMSAERTANCFRLWGSHYLNPVEVCDVPVFLYNHT